MHEVFVVGAARTPIGRFLGALATVPATALGAVAIRAAVERAGVDPAAVDEVVMGNVISAGLGQAPARQAAIRAGIPVAASVTTVNRVCASGLQAIVQGAQAIRLGDARVVVAGGMESMSRGPHLLPAGRTGIRLGNLELVDATVHDGLWCPFENQHVACAADATAEKFGISRAEQDAFALRSHQRAVVATEAGRFRPEIVAVEVEGRTGASRVERDEGPRPDTSLEALARLRPAFSPAGTVTAGNAPGLSDGAAAVVLASEEAVERLRLRPLARLEGYASVGVEPRLAFEAPALAIERLLARVGWPLGDVDLLEVNEAFSAQMLANGKMLGWDWERVNVNGGAVALGHPIGATGARLVVTLLHALREQGRRRGLVSLCHGGGGALAAAFTLV